MKITRTLAAALALLGVACSSTNTGNTVNNGARGANGQPITTGPNNQPVSASANERFTAAATAMRQHDDANNGQGDWTADTCNEVAGLFERAANEQPNARFAEAWFNRGLVFDRCNQADQARQSLQRAIDVSDGNYCRAKVQLGVMLYRQPQRDAAGAQRMFEEAIRQDPTHCVEGYTNLANLLRERNPTNDNEWREVIRNIRSALALDDRYLPARNQLALSYLQQAGDDPNSQRIFLAGLVCAQAIQVAAAHQAELSADVRGYVADLYNTWGIIDIRRNEIIKALEHFRRAYQLNGNMFEAWVNYGTINLSFRGYQDAREAFQHAVQLRDNSYDAHIGLGVAIRGLAQAAAEGERPAMLQQAQQEYERARTLDANRPDSYYNMGVLYMNYMGGQIPDLERAKDFLQQFQQRAGSNARYTDAVTRATRYIRNIDETITALRAVGGGSTPPAGGAAPAPAAGAPTPAAGAAPAAPAAPAAGAPAAPAAH